MSRQRDDSHSDELADALRNEAERDGITFSERRHERAMRAARAAVPDLQRVDRSFAKLAVAALVLIGASLAVSLAALLAGRQERMNDQRSMLIARGLSSPLHVAQDSIDRVPRTVEAAMDFATDAPRDDAGRVMRFFASQLDTARSLAVRGERRT